MIRTLVEVWRSSLCTIWMAHANLKNIYFKWFGNTNEGLTWAVDG